MTSAPAAWRSSTRFHPSGLFSSQLNRLWAGSMPTSRKQSHSSRSGTRATSSVPYICSATTWALFWSIEPTQKRLPVPIASSRPVQKDVVAKENPIGLPW